MRLKLFIFLFTQYLLLNIVVSQNLVRNHSFENYVSLPNPNGYNLENYAFDWQNIQLHTGSPDYFHKNSVGDYSIPSNVRGLQEICDSFAYAGLFLLRTSSFDTFNVHAREYVVGELSQILDPNICYKVSFKYSLAETSQLAISNLGIYFSNSIPVSNASIYSSNYVNYQPQLKINQVMSDTENWVEIERFYTATGNENYFTMGNFRENINTSTFFVKNGTNLQGGKSSYVYLDDIHIEEVPPLTLNQIYLGNDTTLCKGDSLMLNPSLPPNTVRVWNNLSNDSIFKITESGTYWLEAYNGCSYTTDTIYVEFADLEFSLGNDTTLCENEILNLEVNKEGAQYLWNDSTITNSNTIDSSGTYWLQISKDGCYLSDTINVDYNIFEVNLGADTFLCDNEDYLLELNIPNADYLWSDDSKDNTYLVENEEYIRVSVTLDNCTLYDEIEIQYIDSIPNILINDTFFLWY